MPAVFQLVSFLVDYAMPMDDAMHTPRIDASGAPLVTADPALPAGTIDALAERHEVQVARHGIYPSFYAHPNLAGYESSGGTTVGAACVTSPWACAVGARQGTNALEAALRACEEKRLADRPAGLKSYPD